jgi:hypothetical protein
MFRLEGVPVLAAPFWTPQLRSPVAVATLNPALPVDSADTQRLAAIV